MAKPPNKLSSRSKIFYVIDLAQQSWGQPLCIGCWLGEGALPEVRLAVKPLVTAPFVKLLETEGLAQRLALRPPLGPGLPAYVKVDRSDRNLLAALAATRRLILCKQDAAGKRRFGGIPAELPRAVLRCAVNCSATARQQYTLTPQVRFDLADDWQEFELGSVRALSSAGYALLPEALLDVGEPLSPAFLALLQESSGPALGGGQLEKLIDALSADERSRCLHISGLSAAVASAAYAPRLILELSRHNIWQPQHRFRARVLFAYGAQRHDLEVAGHQVVCWREGVYLPRRQELEQAQFAKLKAKGFLFRDTLQSGYMVLTARLLPALAELLADGCEVEALGQPLRHVQTCRVQVAAVGKDWFDLQACLVYDGNNLVDLHTAIAELKAGSSLFQLADGSFALLPTVALERYAKFYELGEKSRKKHAVRFARSQAMLLQGLAERDDVSFSADAAYEAVRTALAGDALANLVVQPGDDFHGTLRHYQQEAVAWLLNLRSLGFGGCLADDMGLGKTVTVLALLEQLRATGSGVGPALVVVPRSLLENWRREAAKFAPKLAVHIYHGPERAVDLDKLSSQDLIILTYGTLRRDAAHLAELELGICILDEAQAIKNPRTHAAVAARALRATWRIALTGTPVENHLGDLWSIFEFLNPGLLGSGQRFARLLANPEELPGETTLQLIGRALRPFLLRRTKQQVLTELPPKTEATLYCELGDRQRLEYDTLLTAARSSLLGAINEQGLNKSKLKIVEVLLRLRQCACHPGLIYPDVPDLTSSKIEVLVENLQQVGSEGHKALVFSQFTSFLRLVRQRLDAEAIAYQYLDGRTQNRQERVDAFQSDPACQVFLISLKAGGLGLNLTAADYVYILDPWWNPAVEAQAMDRAHRMGQAQSVTVYRLIAPNTIEEKVRQLQQRKQALAEAVLSVDNAFVKNLDLADLELLLS